jgi:hypothetical protein
VPQNDPKGSAEIPHLKQQDCSMTAPTATRERAAQTPSMSLVLGADAQLPDLTKPANLVKFAALFSGDQLSKLSAEQQAVFLTTLGNHLGVRAELGEIMLYQGKPYITIDGRIRIAHRSGLLNGIDPGPASSMERTRYIVKDGEHLWKCYVFKKGALKPFIGWGHVRLGDRNPVSKTHPQEMAKKRAKYDALRLAFPPNEELTPLHEQYIQEAEDEAKRLSPSQMTGDYDDAPDDETVLTEEIAADARVTQPAADDTPSFEEEPAIESDLNAMTLEQAKAVTLIGPEGSWQGKAGQLLISFSNGHLEKIRTWLREKIQERGEDRDFETMATAISLILDDRAKDQATLEFDSTKTAAKVGAMQGEKPAEQKKPAGKLPF